MRAVLIAAASLGAAMFLGTAAQADTYNFSVPVHVQKLMPALGTVQVQCKLYDKSNNEITYNWSKSANLDSSGGYQGVLAIQIVTEAGAVKPVSYACYLALGFPDGKLFDLDLTQPVPDDRGRALPGSTFVPVVKGPIPVMTTHTRSR